MKDILFLVVLGFMIFLFIKLKKKFKTLKIGALTLITGGVKCGKTTLSVYLVKREIKQRQKAVKLQNFVNKLFGKELLDIPQVYSNVPLNFPYIELTEELLLRKEKFIYGSVIYICEASLVADSQSYHNEEYNDKLLLFNKLIAHETHGGCLIYDTQNFSDCHYSIKRSLSNYFYIHHLAKVPFFLIAFVKEYCYSEDNNIINTNNSDLEEDLKMVLIPKSTFKLFDRYCFSSLTDNLETNKNIGVSDTLKVRKILTIKDKCKKQNNSNSQVVRNYYEKKKF